MRNSVSPFAYIHVLSYIYIQCTFTLLQYLTIKTLIGPTCTCMCITLRQKIHNYAIMHQKTWDSQTTHNSAQKCQKWHPDEGYNSIVSSYSIKTRNVTMQDDSWEGATWMKSEDTARQTITLCNNGNVVHVYMNHLPTQFWCYKVCTFSQFPLLSLVPNLWRNYNINNNINQHNNICITTNIIIYYISVYIMYVVVWLFTTIVSHTWLYCLVDIIYTL